ncbi:MFS transporter [Ornithobacterium rhinotracheale]|uniref:MFS transporter n=1 Tax=Ornithobacterium rhinotracheale TaxID=28251 RepID=UPI00129C763A|nr:MFS transporter [Ornithobacterium rhinotracheale]MRJ10231.1 MFS transporter [Ornithobacterium rhinotracheale]
MEENNKTFMESIKTIKPAFWLASFMELMERWAWYGLFGVFSLYLVASTDEGGLGFNHIEKASIMSQITALLYFLPLFLGVIADRIGYKLSLIIAYVIMIIGYYFLGHASTYWSVYFLFLLVALGAAMFKPVASGIVSKSTNKDNGTIGFGIFYMMVNIGGFVGPASSSYLRTTFGWRLIFVQAAVVIAINLFLVVFFFKEPERQVYKKESIGVEIKNSLNNIWEALKDTKLTVLLVLMIGFWTMFNQLFYTLPNFITDWVDSAPLSNWINQNIPALSNTLTENGQIKAEWFTNIDALMIVFLQIGVSYFATKMRHVSAMIRGFIIASIGIGLTFYTHNYMYTILGTVIFAIGEMTTNPTFSSFIALISPKGKEALYQGTYFLPVAAGNFFTSFISGNLYEAWSDKLSLCQRYMDEKGIPMPKVGDGFTKRDYFALAEQKLGLTHWQLTDLLWDTYSPNKIWYVIVGVGAITIVALSIYDRVVIRPREKKHLLEE